MRTTGLLVGLAVILSSCAWLRTSRPAPLEEDRSIVFPQFFEQPAIKVGVGNGPYEMDGVTLRALLMATADFLPPADKDTPCRDRIEAHRYRVIRQGDIVFVQIEDDDEFCGLKYLSLDTGAKYAISTDGRILRRLIGTEPEVPEPGDGGSGTVPPSPPPTPSSAPDGGSPASTDASLGLGPPP